VLGDVGDRLQTDNGTAVTVATVATEPGASMMYDLTVDTTHTYHVYAGEQPVLVHNQTVPPDPVSGGRLVTGKFPKVGAGPGEVLYRVDAAGNVAGYAEYDAAGNIVRRVDMTGATHNGVGTPHVHDIFMTWDLTEQFTRERARTPARGVREWSVKAMNIQQLPIITAFGNTLRSSDGLPATPLSAWEFLNFKSGLQFAVAYSSLFWPEFTLHNGLVFISEKFSVASFDAAVSSGLGFSAVQDLLNHVHVWDLFDFCEEQFSEPFAQYLAHVLQSAWSAKLVQDFPGLPVTVTLLDQSYGPELIVRQSAST
jgi:hypothetical protein